MISCTIKLKDKNDYILEFSKIPSIGELIVFDYKETFIVEKVAHTFISVSANLHFSEIVLFVREYVNHDNSINT